MVLVEVTEVQDHVWDEAALKDTEQSPAGEEGGSTGKPELAGRHDGPENHLRGNPAVGTDPFGDELGGKLGAEEGEFED